MSLTTRLRYPLFITAGLLLAAFIGLQFSGKSYAAGETTTHSPVNTFGNIKGVVGAQSGGGVYSSDTSTIYLYVPKGSGDTNITVSAITNQYSPAGRLSAFVVGYLGNDNTSHSTGPSAFYAPGGGFTAAYAHLVPAPGNFTGANDLGPNDIKTIDIGGGNLYSVYIVTIATSAGLGATQSADVTFVLDTPGPNYIGSFPGPQGDDTPGAARNTLGTGYYGAGGQAGGWPTLSAWDMAVGFATPCNVGTQAGYTISLYDLDTYQAVNASMSIQLLGRPRSGGGDSVVGISGDITDNGNGTYRPFDASHGAPYDNSGATWHITANGGFQDNIIYTLVLRAIGRNNKIRVRIPFDQINSIVTCPNPVTPSCYVTVDNALPIHPGDIIHFTAHVDNAGIYSLGVNGPSADGGRGYVPNYFATGVRAIRGSPVGLGDGADSAFVFGTNAHVDRDYDDVTWIDGGGRSVQNLSFPAPGQYDFNWTLVQPDVGWAPVTCTSTAGPVPGKITITTADVCTNIPGDQASVPGGYYKTPPDASTPGYCYTDAPPTPSISQNCNVATPYVEFDIADPDYGTNGGSPIANYSFGGATTSVSSRHFTVTRPTIDQAILVGLGSYGVDPSPPGGYGEAASYRGTSLVLPACGVPFSLLSKPQPPVPDDPDEPSVASFVSYIDFSSTATTVNGVNSTRTYFVYRGGTYTAATGALSGGSVLRNLTAPPNTPATSNINTPHFLLANDPNVAIGVALQGGDYICNTLVTTPGSGLVTTSGTILNPSGNSTFTACTPIVDRPYLKVYGGEVQAGSSFDTGCPLVTAGIYGSAKQTGGFWKGAGSQFGAYAGGNITGFATATLLRPDAPSALAFANMSPATVAPASGVFGGSYGSRSCATEFWQSIIPAVTPGATFNLDRNSSGAYHLPAGVTLTQTAGAADYVRHSVTLYVDAGDLTVASDINTVRSVTDVADLPQLYIVVRGGNILVRPNVLEMDGLYAAEPTATTNGRIVTCTNPAGIGSTTSNWIANNCRNKLTVVGALLAYKVDFLRIKGAVRSATTSETADNCNANLPSCNIAETIQFSPELLLGEPAEPIKTTSNQLQSILSLPPSL